LKQQSVHDLYSFSVVVAKEHKLIKSPVRFWPVAVVGSFRPNADLRSKSKCRTSFRYRSKKRTRNESLKQAIQEHPLASQQKTEGASMTNLHSIPYAVEADHRYAT
jgi:hypothetical protein